MENLVKKCRPTRVPLSFRLYLTLLALVFLPSCAGWERGSDASNWMDSGGLADQEVAAAPGSPKPMAVIQREVMDYADLFSTAVGMTVDQMLLEDVSAEFRVEALAWKVRQVAAAMEIAAGPDPRNNLLDMAIFVSASDWALETEWNPEVFNPHGKELQSVYRDMQRRVWELTGGTLTPGQTANLRALVTQWTATAPPLYEVSGVRFRNLEGVEPANFENGQTGRGLLANVRRWLGEVNTSLLFSERLMFYLERTQRILSQQSDLTIAQVGSNFPVSTIQPDFDALAAYLELWPGRLQAGIEENRVWVDALLPEVNQTLGTANQVVTGSTALVQSAQELSGNLERTLERLEALAARTGSREIPTVDLEKNILSVQVSLHSLESSIQGINQLLATDETGASPASDLVNQLNETGEGIVDSIYRKALWLLGYIFAGLVVLVLFIWLLFRHRPVPRQTTQP